MPWCPKCGDEYREGFNLCPQCNEALVDQKQATPTENKTLLSDITLLTSVQDIKQAEIIESLLSSYEIPIFKKHKGTGEIMDIYMGMSVMGIDIYVSETNLEEAKSILLSNEFESQNYEEENVVISDIIDVEDDSELLEEMNQNYERKRRFRAWIILLLFIPGIVSILIGIIIFLLQYFS